MKLKNLFTAVLESASNRLASRQGAQPFSTAAESNALVCLAGYLKSENPDQLHRAAQHLWGLTPPQGWALRKHPRRWLYEPANALQETIEHLEKGFRVGDCYGWAQSRGFKYAYPYRVVPNEGAVTFHKTAQEAAEALRSL
jgi:hypothetical protein